jgi:hypothetical protein
MGKTFSTGLLTNGVFQDASNNIGIGAAPSGTYKLEVTGTAKVSSTLLVSGAATFSSSLTAGGKVTATGGNFIYALEANAGTTSGQSYGLKVTGGTTSTDDAMVVYNAAASSTLFRISGTGAATFSSSVTAAGGVVVDAANATASYTINKSGVGKWLTYNEPTNDNYIIREFGVANRLVIQPTTGNVGIGTTTPIGKLNVKGGRSIVTATASDSNIFVEHTGSLGVIGVTYDTGGAYYPLAFNTSDTERLRITSAGDMYLTGRSTNGDYGMYFYSNDTDSRIYSSNSGAVSKPLQFYTAGTERMRITSGGNQFVYANTAASWVTEMYNDTSSTPYGIYLKYRNAAPNSTGSSFLRFDDSSANRLQVYSNGGLANYSGNNVNLASDIRLKKDITLLSSEWDKLKQIEVVNFKYKDSKDETALYGAIAQQIQNIYPELVVVTREATETEPEYYGLREQPFQWLTTKVLQEAMTKIEEQQIQIQNLQEQNQDLKSRLDKAGL